MERIFKYRASYYLVHFIILLICFVGIYLIEQFIIRAILFVCFFGTVVLIIKLPFTHFKVSDDGISKKELFKVEILYWNEIKFLCKLPTSKGKRVFVGIYADNKKLIIPFWIKDYREIVKIAVERNDNSKSEIHENVYDILGAGT